jgi:hypothetical protein
MAKSKPKDTSDPAMRAALDLQLGKLRRWEGDNDAYQEMCRSADAKVAAATEAARAKRERDERG